MSKTIRFLTLSIVAGVWAVACGGSSDSSGGNTAGSHSTQCMGAEDTTKCTTCLDTAEMMNQTINDLVICSCKNCADELAACFQGPDATENAKCQAVVLCAQMTGCAGTECYCGVGVTLADCLNTGPMGPCKDEIAKAAACDTITDPVMQATCVSTARAMAGSTLQKASAVGDCATGDPAQMPPVVGACQ